jgi:hypothetical protein
MAATLGAPESTVLIPDIGGTLYYSKLRIIDLAGLADPTIARTLGKDQAAFYDYIFDEVKPTFIHTHEYWVISAYLDGDPRFREDYLPIDEAIDLWVLQNTKLELYSGTYVRKDAVGNPTQLAALRKIFRTEDEE